VLAADRVEPLDPANSIARVATIEMTDDRDHGGR